MAVYMIKSCCTPNQAKFFTNLWTQYVRSKSSARVVMTDDSAAVVCWHPEKSFPYEMSKPVPKIIKTESDSVLKVQSNKELLSVLKPKRQEVVIEELTKITHTTKHIWYPPKHQFRKKKPIAMDRPYL